MGPEEAIGPRRRHTPAMALSDSTVLDLQGIAVPVAGLWADGPVVVAFLRHYG